MQKAVKRPEIRWIGTRFPQDDGTHNWEELRKPEEYEVETWIRRMFRAPQSLKPITAAKVPPTSGGGRSELTGVQTRVDPYRDLETTNINPPNVATEGQQYRCQKCGSVTWIEPGKRIQCRTCNRRRQQRWRENHPEEARAKDRARKREERT